MRNKIWASFCNIKFQSYLLGILIDKYQKLDRNINIFLALTTSSSVASWAIWQKYHLLWSIIILVSQVIQVVKPYFPYFKFVKELNIVNQKVGLIAIDFEKLWYKFDSKKISEQDASEEYFALKKMISEAFNFGEDVLLSTSKSNVNKANQRMKIFLKSNYNIDISINQKKNVQ